MCGRFLPAPPSLPASLMLLPFDVQGSTVEDVCRQLRRLYVVKNFSLEHSVSITCDPSFSAGNEIHVCIVRISGPASGAARRPRQTLRRFSPPFLQSTEDHQLDRSPIKELTDRIIDLVSKRSVNNTILTAIAEVRVPSPSRTGMSHLQTPLVACECAACTDLHVYKWVCVCSFPSFVFIFVLLIWTFR